MIKQVTIKVNEAIRDKARLVAKSRKNGESMGAVIGNLLDKELERIANGNK